MRAGTTRAFAAIATALACLALAGPAVADDPYVSQVADLNPSGNGVSAGGLGAGVPLGNSLYFQGNDSTHGPELFATDGGAPVLVKDINPTGTAGSGPINLTRVGTDTIFFSANDGTHGSELWKSDGSGTGTTLVKDINTTTPTASTQLIWLTDVGGELFFRANDGTSALWKSDGSEAGTTKVKDVPGNGVLGTTINFMRAVNGLAIFRAYDPDVGVELWRSDGTGPGTVPIGDINPGSADSGWNGSGALLGGYFYFPANDGTHGTELWRTDGFALERVTDVNPAGDANPTGLTQMGGAIYFSADDGSGPELWRTDGTTTRKVKDIAAGASGSTPLSLTAVGSTLYFQADDGSHGAELWRSDGTAAGTTMVRDINGGAASSAVSNPVDFAGTLYFYADDGTHGTELWRSDGSEIGTVLVKDVRPGSGSSIPSPSPAPPTPVGDNLYFQADDGTTGLELWRAQRLPRSDLDHVTLDFGPVEAASGISPVRTVTVTNNGGAPLVISGVQLGGANPSDYWIVSNSCGAPVAVNGSCSVGLRFTPPATGDRGATLTFASNASNASSAVTLLKGSGTEAQQAQTTTVTNTVTQVIPGDPPARDTTAPHVTISGLPATIKRAKLLKGVTLAVGTDEPAALAGDLLATARSAALGRIRASGFNLVLAHTTLGEGSGERTLRLRPSRKLIGRAKRFKLQVTVVATDAAGNRTTAMKVLQVR